MGKTEVDQRHFPKTFDFEHFLAKIFLKTFPKNVAPFTAVILVEKKFQNFFKIIQKKAIDGGWSGPFSTFSQFFPLFPFFTLFQASGHLPVFFPLTSGLFLDILGHFLAIFGHFWAIF